MNGIMLVYHGSWRPRDRPGGREEGERRARQLTDNERTNISLRALEATVYGEEKGRKHTSRTSGHGSLLQFLRLGHFHGLFLHRIALTGFLLRLGG